MDIFDGRRQRRRGRKGERGGEGDDSMELKRCVGSSIWDYGTVGYQQVRLKRNGETCWWCADFRRELCDPCKDLSRVSPM